MKATVSEKKSVKTLKGQLFGALSMMLVASIALGTSTYAWFVNNSTVEVSNMQLTVSASEYLQIAVKTNPATDPNPAGAANPYTSYKNLLTMADINTVTAVADGVVTGAGWTNMFSSTSGYQLVPASTVDAVTDTSFFMSLGGMVGTDLSTFGPVTIGANGNEGSVKKIVLSFKSSTAADIYFGGMKDADNPFIAISDFISDATDTDSAAVAKALRIAVAPTGGTPVIFQFSDAAAGSALNTLYPAGETTPVTGDDTKGLYRAISAVDTNHLITTTAAQTAVLATGKKSAAPSEDYLAAVAKNATGGAPTITVTGKTPLFSLTADTAKDVAIYFWLEGVDGDCTVDLAKMDFNIRLPFASAPTPAVAP